MKIIIGVDPNGYIRAAVTDKSAQETDVLDMVRNGLVVEMIEAERVTIGSHKE